MNMSSKKARNEVDGEVETQVSSDEPLSRYSELIGGIRRDGRGHGASGLVFW